MTIKYPFTHDGVKLFMEFAYADIFAALDRGDTTTDPIVITIGKREIEVPNTAWAYQCLEEYLQEVATDYYGEA
jgi:hypothetical protein